VEVMMKESPNGREIVKIVKIELREAAGGEWEVAVVDPVHSAPNIDKKGVAFKRKVL
jgi:hypothetical protein